jgi:hypothetical protein
VWFLRFQADFFENQQIGSLPLMAAVSFFSNFFCLGRLVHAKKLEKRYSEQQELP